MLSSTVCASGQARLHIVQAVPEFSSRPLWLQNAVAAALQQAVFEANTVVVPKGAVPGGGADGGSAAALYLVTDGELIMTTAPVDEAALSSGTVGS